MRSSRLERLLGDLRELHQALGDRVAARWHRSLPFPDELFDRWERARRLGFGDQTSIYQDSYVYGDVTVGAHTWIGPSTILDGTGGLVIGDYCSISAGVQIYTHDTVRWAVSGGRAPYEHAPVTIRDCCHIGAQSVIGRGVTVGPHAVIGALSFVNADVPPRSVAVGVPARVIGTIEIDAGGEMTIRYTSAARRAAPNGHRTRVPAARRRRAR
jgi:acetyltransferase-like isoleucine patch superfamily enzyme